MIRFIIIVILLVLFLILMIPVMLILLLISKFNKKLSSDIAQAMVAFTFRLMILVTGSKVTIIGKDNIPKDKGVLFVSNHRSYFDILFGYGYTPKKLGFVAKAEMLKYPLLNIWMKLVNCLFLDRNDIKKGLKTILNGIENVKNDVSVWICPEGTRNKNTDNLNIAEFKEGALKIAEKSGCAVVPVAIYGTSEIFEQHFPKMAASNVTIEYGKPFYIKDLDKEERKKAGSYSRNIILTMLEKEKENRK